jgi:hypothetical protein
MFYYLKHFVPRGLFSLSSVLNDLYKLSEQGLAMQV